MRCSRCSDHLDEFVEGTLGPADRAEVAEHVEWCSACATLLEELRVVDALLYSGAAPVELPANFSFRVMAEVRSVPQVMPHRTPMLKVLAGYLAFAWTTIALWFAFGPASAHASFSVLRDALLQYWDAFSFATDSVAQVFGRGIFGVAASVSIILGLDIVVSALVIAAYFMVRPSVLARAGSPRG